MSTPRCGNTWLRLMLNQAYQFDQHDQGELALYNPLEAPWDELPDRCILMTHWHRVEPLVSLLKQHGFLIVTLARHPLDVLLSILQYSACEGSLRWLEGLEGDERSIFQAAPMSEEFQRYAIGARGRALLSVSPQWWTAPGCHRIRYEDLVANPLRSLTRLSRRLGVEPAVGLDDVVEAHRIEQLRKAESKRIAESPIAGPGRHFWQGRPDLWKSLFSAEVATRIATAQHEAFSVLGYTCRPDRAMDDSKAHQNWLSLSSSRGPSHTSVAA